MNKHDFAPKSRKSAAKSPSYHDVKKSFSAPHDHWYKFGFHDYLKAIPDRTDDPDIIDDTSRDKRDDETWENWIYRTALHEKGRLLELDRHSRIIDQQIAVLTAKSMNFKERLIDEWRSLHHTYECLLFHGFRVKDLINNVDHFSVTGYQGFIYIIKEYRSMSYKIGRTRNLNKRLERFDVKMPFEWSFIAIFFVDDTRKEEKYLHEHFKTKRINGEWFKLDHDDLLFIYRKYYPLVRKYSHLLPQFEQENL